MYIKIYYFYIINNYVILLLLNFNFFFISSIYLYDNNGFSQVFKKILKYLDYEVDNDIENEINNLPNKIIVISSHTSIYDFIIGIMFYYGYLRNKYDTYILMKKEFEKITKPFLYLFDQKIKLISVNKDHKNGLTNQICNSLKYKDNYILYMAPEGTRKCTNNIRTGYWVISKKLDLDIVYIGIDFSAKTISLEKNRKPNEEWEDEKNEFIKSSKKYIPMYPDRCYWTKDFYQ